MYPAYWDGYHPRKIAPADMKEVERILKLASSEKETNNLIVRFLRTGVPIHMGNKSEPLIVSMENRHHTFEHALHLFGDYGYNVWVETKSGQWWEDRFLNMITSFPNEIGVGISLVPNFDFADRMEPDCDSPKDRFESVLALSSNDINAGIKAEPIMPTINDDSEHLCEFFELAEECEARWITFFNYKTRRRPMAKIFFEQEGYDFDMMYAINQDDSQWCKIGQRIFEYWKINGWDKYFRLTTADIFTFPLQVNGTCCCGWDIPGHSKINFQHVVETIKAKGSCSWADIEKDVWEVLPKKELTRFRQLFLYKHEDRYTLHDCPEFKMESGKWRKRRRSEFHGWGHVD